MTTGILCKCNFCGTIMYDENPADDAFEQSTEEPVENMAMNTDDIEDIFWMCPVCETDDYLDDFI